MPDTIALPPLDHFTRDELCELVRVLHDGIVRAQADYLELYATATKGLDFAKSALEASR